MTNVQNKSVGGVSLIKVLAVIGLLIVGCVAALIFGKVYNPTPFSQEDVDLAVTEAKSGMVSQATLLAELDKVKSEMYTSDQVKSEIEAALLAYELDRANETQTETQSTSGSEDVQSWVEEYMLGDEVQFDLDDNDVEKLIDDEVSHDGTDYDVYEEVMLSGDMFVSTSVTDEDFEAETYLTLENKNVLVYRYVFKDGFDVADLSDDKPLTITFLGQVIDIVDADTDEITLLQGEEYYLNVGEEIKFDNKTIKLINVGSTGTIAVDVDGVYGTVQFGDNKDINGINIGNFDSFYEDNKVERTAIIRIGSDVKHTVESGDAMELFGQPEDEDDAEWVWDIEVNGGMLDSLSAVYNQKRRSLDDEFTPLKEDDMIVFPNDYLTVEFTKLSQPKYLQYTFEFEDKIMHITSDDDEGFVFGTDEYDEVYVDATGVYDKDLVFINNDIDLAETGYVLDADFIFGDLDLDVDYVTETFTLLEYDGTDISSKDCDYLTYESIIVNDVEDNYDDNELILNVPDEDLEVKISVY